VAQIGIEISRMRRKIGVMKEGDISYAAGEGEGDRRNHQWRSGGEQRRRQAA